MTRTLPTIFRTILSTSLLGSFMVTMAPVKAQLVLIPDTNFRNLLNSIIFPPVVDANGFMDTTNTTVTQSTLIFSATQLTVDWAVSDLTGIQYFDALEELFINYTSAAVNTSIPAFPGALRYLHVLGSPAATLPALPDSITSLRLYRNDFNSLPPMPSSLYSCIISNSPNLSQIPALPNSVWHVLLDSLPALTSWPVIPSTVLDLSLGRVPLNQLPTLPSGLHMLTVNDLPLTSFPAWPNLLSTLRLFSIPLSMIPPLPPLEQLVIHDMPISTMPSYPSALRKLELNDIPVNTLSPFPSTLNTLQLRAVPVVTIPALTSPYLQEVELIDLPVNALPPWPSPVIHQVVLKDLPQLTTLPPWHGERSGGIVLEGLPLLTSLPDMPDTVDVSLVLRDLSNITNIPDLAPLTYCNSLTIEEMPALTSITGWPTFDMIKQVIDCPALECLPPLPPPVLDPNNVVYVLNTGVTCAPNERVIDGATMTDLPICSVLNSNCPDIWPIVTGHVFHDHNNNGALDAGEPPYPGVIVDATPGYYMTASQNGGSFLINFPPGSYSLDVVPGLYQTVSTQPYVANVPNFGTIDSLVEFGIHTSPNIQDLRANLLSYPARPGFDNMVWMRATNVGTMDTVPTLTFTFDNDQSWVSSTPVPDQLVGNTATWTGPSIAPGMGFQVEVLLHTDSLQPLGTLLTHDLTIDPLASDTTPNDNVVIWNDTVVGSYDPNDKLLSPATMTPAEVQTGDTPIDYTIRFQNTGTYQAERVVIVDTLSSDLHWDSFEFIGSSHPCNWYMLDGVLHFIFDPIFLPDSTSDEPHSHGFVQFSILPSDQLQNGETVENIAHIVFDFNEPIVTPPAVFEVDVTVDIAEHKKDGILLYPNPAGEWLLVSLPEGLGSNATISITDMAGKMVQRSAVIKDKTHRISVQRLLKGMYMLEVVSSKARYIERFIKR